MTELAACSDGSDYSANIPYPRKDRRLPEWNQGFFEMSIPLITMGVTGLF